MYVAYKRHERDCRRTDERVLKSTKLVRMNHLLLECGKRWHLVVLLLSGRLRCLLARQESLYAGEPLRIGN
jgi:hypothetical protein